MTNNDIQAINLQLKSICDGIDKADARQDKASQFRLTLVLCVKLCQHHETLRSMAVSIEDRAKTIAKIPTSYINREMNWHCVKLPRMIPIDAEVYISYVNDLAMHQQQWKSLYNVLNQYAKEFCRFRTRLTERTLIDNKTQRACQNILLASIPDAKWRGRLTNTATLFGCISGEFDHYLRYKPLGKLYLKPLHNRKENRGVKSTKEGQRIVSNMRTHYCDNVPNILPTSRLSKSTRCDSVQNYVDQSKYYRKRCGWIKGIQSIRQLLRLMPNIDSWKEQFEATNRLAYLTASNVNPYVLTIATSRPVQIGSVEVAETSIPVYRVDCLCETGSKFKPTIERQLAFFLGKTGSRTVDDAIESVEWYHTSNDALLTASVVSQTVLGIFNTRLSGLKSEKQTLKERRKEIAAYARKLVWIETINMLDSKQAGNCLPGTLQFCNQLGVSVPESWSDYSVDSRMLLRKWKSANYDANRLLFPAIDAAVNRLKSQLLSVTATYVPSVVK